MECTDLDYIRQGGGDFGETGTTGAMQEERGAVKRAKLTGAPDTDVVTAVEENNLCV